MRILVHLEAPKAREPSLKPLGIDRMDSSLAAIITGKAIMAKVNQRDHRDAPPKEEYKHTKSEKSKHYRGYPGQVQNR